MEVLFLCSYGMIKRRRNNKNMYKKCSVCIIILIMIIGLVGCQSKSVENNEYTRIVHLDCGRKYFSKKDIKNLIDEASTGNISQIELAIGNDGLRFLLDDMSIEINGKVYESEQIKEGIHKGNEAYADFEIDELYEDEMNEIIEHAHSKGINIIPLINSPGHMDSILSCIGYCGIENASYHGSKRTIDVSNREAVSFTQALLKKYVEYFASKGCTYFSIGADEYANDIYSKWSMGFGQLIKNNEYGFFIDYVNNCAKIIKEYKMIPMAFNDGIYYNNNTNFGMIDTDIVICYWTNGWLGYSPCSAKQLSEYGFKLINTNSDYYWVLGNKRWQCSETKIQKFNVTKFKGGRIENPMGAMFCIWCDDPQEDASTVVIEQTKELIRLFGK